VSSQLFEKKLFQIEHWVGSDCLGSFTIQGYNGSVGMTHLLIKFVSLIIGMCDFLFLSPLIAEHPRHGARNGFMSLFYDPCEAFF
jgi:hypothetical protein